MCEQDTLFGCYLFCNELLKQFLLIKKDSKMKNSIQDLKNLLTKGEKLSNEKLMAVKGGCGTVKDPRRCY